MNQETLSIDEKTLLLHCLNKDNPGLIVKLDKLEEGLIDKNTINDMRFAVMIEQTREGFNEVSDLNEYGLKLEKLIEKLGRLYLWPLEERHDDS
jgi:hypothetical protein